MSENDLYDKAFGDGAKGALAATKHIKDAPWYEIMFSRGDVAKEAIAILDSFYAPPETKEKTNVE